MQDMDHFAMTGLLSLMTAEEANATSVAFPMCSHDREVSEPSAASKVMFTLTEMCGHGIKPILF